MATLSFKFTKSSKKTILNPSNETNLKGTEDEDKILSIEGAKIESTRPKIEKKELVIPLIQQNKWRQKDGVDVVKTENMSLNEKAVAEILQDAERNNENWNNRDKDENDDYQIPLIMRNMVPEGYETEDKLDVSLRPEISTLDDYEAVPIEHFGKAILRGMGWKKDEGIGARNKQVVKPIEAVIRPKGLGLGADPKLVQKMKSGQMDDDKTQDFVKGGYVKVHHGPHRDLYGQIEGLDEDNSRVNVKLTISGKNLTLSKFVLTVVSKKEYKKEAKVINKDKYMEYVREKNEKESEKRKLEDDRPNYKDERSYCKKRKEKHHSEENYERDSSRQAAWVRPSLRVRFIDKKYRHGKYYNSKVIVEDVISENSCICQTDNGRLIEDVHPNQLETVVPKSENANVMVVGQGSYKNKVGKIVKRDKAKCKATVQLYDDHSLVKLHFDSVCEFIGDIPEYL